MATLSRGQLLFGAVIAASFGTFLIARGSFDLRRELAAKRWPSVEGEIIGRESRSRGTGQSQSRHWHYTYEYAANGTRHEGTHTGSSANAPPDHSVGDKIEVFYNPEKVSISVIDPGFHPSNLVPVGMGLLSIGLGAWLLCAAWKKVGV